MGAPRDDDTLARERTRVGRIYAGYRASAHKRRAWSTGNPGNAAIRAELLEAVRRHAGPPLESAGEILDVGCGTGFWLGTLRGDGVDPARLVGVDLLPERVAAARAHIPEATVIEADARALPFEPDRFALALQFTVLSSLAGPEGVRAALSEARRVLAPGGILLVYEPRLPSPLNRHVRRVRDADLAAARIEPRDEERLTLLPPLARMLGRATPAAYPRLAALPPLRSHRLVAYRKA